ncbi:DNA-methyltransferase [Limnochorda pilosa]|uniref:DNA methylase n=1 Tax=Limnochorda pilosa TaxID=1555112 RepID=A0A0K2SQE0_LIMPI|nr:site-specific DNA-methyltransferase [Limnochorda pilosa]BAS29316.1 DNA methylase [Limnochorda pilosa]
MRSSDRAFVRADNLDVLRELPDGAFDLVYLDPPFNSNRRYGLDRGQPDRAFRRGRRADGPWGLAFDDAWRWDEETAAGFHGLLQRLPPGPRELLATLRQALGAGDLLAYLAMMVPRLVELHRVLAPTGSLYLHCDPQASHYLKLFLDSIFGADRFRREIVWRSGWVSGFKSRVPNWVRNHDTLLYYTRGPRFVFNKEAAYQPHPEGYQRRGGGANPRGVALDDVWTDIYSPWIMSFSKEKLGYPTQKPMALMERIVRVSTRPGMRVLDPFAGGGAALVAAEAMGRRWLGIDSTHLATAMIRYRMLWRFGLDRSRFPVHGEPHDLSAARALARNDPLQFGWWTLSLVHARPLGAGRTQEPGAGPRIEGALPASAGVLDDETPPALAPGSAAEIPWGMEGGPPWTLVIVQAVLRPADLPDLVQRARELGAQRVLATALELPAGATAAAGAVAGQGRFGWAAPEDGVQLVTLEDLLRRDLTPALIQRPLPQLHLTPQPQGPRGRKGRRAGPT